MAALHTLGLAELVALVRQRDVSPVAIAEDCLKRIDTLEPRLQAWVTLDRQGAIEAAKRCEQRIQRREEVGLLAGAPVGLKDIFYTAGLLTTAGSQVYADFVPDYDATSVVRLKEAGATIMGKAVTTEFATSDPSPTRNPWNTAHTPGGSSSGSAVAVSARMIPAALGSQTGGSTLRPAAYTGIIGLKASYGRISRYGVIPVSWCLDHVGILVRSVADAATLLQAIAGPDPHDPGALTEPVGAYTTAVQQADTPPRIGVLHGYFADHAEAETRQHTDAVAQKLARAGAVVQDVALPPSFGSVLAAQRLIMKVEMAAFHADMFMTQRHRYRPKIRESIESGLVTPGVDYLRAQRLRRLFQDEVSDMFQAVDVLLTPATPAPAPRDRSTTGDASFQAPWTYAGVPAMALPSGLSESGMPLGIQLIAPRLQEECLLRAARWCEAALEVALAPPV
ncbi:putative amidase AmiD [Candidatus Entotheonellaceae bacterium PAL068K]